MTIVVWTMQGRYKGEVVNNFGSSDVKQVCPDNFFTVQKSQGELRRQKTCF